MLYEKAIISSIGNLIRVGVILNLIAILSSGAAIYRSTAFTGKKTWTFTFGTFRICRGTLFATTRKGLRHLLGPQCCSTGTGTSFYCFTVHPCSSSERMQGFCNVGCLVN